MSGYGGQHWQDPYQGWSGDPHGTPGWQDPYGAPGSGYGPPVPPASNGSAVAALVCNIIATLACCLGFSVAGIVTAAVAMSRTQTDPNSARSLTKWSWGLFAANVGLAVLGFLAYMLALYLSLVAPGESPFGDIGGSGGTRGYD